MHYSIAPIDVIGIKFIPWILMAESTLFYIVWTFSNVGGSMVRFWYVSSTKIPEEDVREVIFCQLAELIGNEGFKWFTKKTAQWTAAESNIFYVGRVTLNKWRLQRFYCKISTTKDIP